MKRDYIRTGILVILFIISLSALRLIWVGVFQENITPAIVDGELDLSTWEIEDSRTLQLDGEWDFYPSQFIIQENTLPVEAPETIEVPNGWENKLGSPFGYGSYRLQMKVQPDDDRNFKLYIPKIPTSSEIYVNGREVAKIGQPAETEAEYTANVMPQTLTFTADEEGNIDIVIQVANYKDSRKGGIYHSLRFGTEETIMREVQLTNYSQVVIAALLLIHTVYALIIYFIGGRVKKVLSFALLTFSLFSGFLFYTGEKLLQQFVNISYDLEYWLIHTVYLINYYAYVQCTDHQKLPYWNKIFPFFKWGMAALAFVTIFLSMPQILALRPIYNIFAFVTVVVTVASITRMYKNNPKSTYLLLFGFIAIANHGIWNFIWTGQSVYLTFYPFDMMIFVTCYTIFWFRGYFQKHQETKKVAERLKKVNEEKDQFLANTSHEFRNPLNSILLLSEAIRDREKTTLSKRSINELNTVLNVGQQMNLLLTELLEVRSLQVNKPRLNKQVIALEPIVIGVIDILRLSSDVKGLSIVNQISKEFPYVYADENRVKQIFFNLIDNAIKYTHHGSITISASVKENNAEIQVMDTGIGISEEVQKRIFQPYEQGQTSNKMAEGGFGLGLSITKQLIELHGGAIRVSSKKGEKTTFTFTLALASQKVVESPREEQTEEAVKKEKREQTELPSWTDGQAPSVLVVDDNPASLLALKAILPEEMYNTVFVSCAKQAVEELKKREWDIIISDIMMPEISGYELTRIIRERFSLTELPVLLLTGGSTDIQAAFLAGANDYITKPVEPVELKARMDSLITLKHVAEQQIQLETSWLQAQIKPHFLFNTLNSIMALSELDLEGMKKLLNEFSNLLRSKFQFQHMKDLIPLEEELKIVRSYLYIEQVRFGEILQVNWELKDEQGVHVPLLSIQPLVENAVLHGIRNRQGKGTVTISCKKDYSHSIATITVEDDGGGVEEAEIQNILNGESKSKSGVGIFNVDKRLHQHFGRGLKIVSSPDQGMKVFFEVDLGEME
ncbi:ATP-binding response regulator [Gracilibacillus alcaliphilus]|uniref:ATP-binding response regulator n=1 Tax=Gracilibacillus alcaliphilus TaxID=1401441 RepID=UPI00195CEC89|nr:ATP-binding protein [Gracilibacillus alcaliphilus]MBM7675911.1 sensor histidine kinase YesM [Gracilibacillus alcaliphilus]